MSAAEARGASSSTFRASSTWSATRGASAVGSGLGVYVFEGGAVPGGRTLIVFSGASSLGVWWVPG